MKPAKGVCADQRGISLVEFGLIAPVMCLLFMGSLDAGHTVYMKSVLEGAVQKAARDAGLETGLLGASQAAVDTKVREQILALANNGTVTINRRYYRTFNDAALRSPETFTDTNGNGVCDGEPYVDRNNNNVRDLDGADAGQGNARDSVLYTVSITYPRMFPLHGLINIPATVSLAASTVMANQPYGDQAVYGAPTTRTCPTP